MQYRELSVPGSWEITPPKQFGDDRGVFLEWFKQATFAEATGRSLDLQQANCSVSAAGVLRGIHFADVPPGQAKYVTCVSGSVLDVVVDLRAGSPPRSGSGIRCCSTPSIGVGPSCRRAWVTGSSRSRTTRPSCTCVRRATTRNASTRCILWTRRSGSTGRPSDPTGGALEYELSGGKDQAAPTLAEARDAGRLPKF